MWWVVVVAAGAEPRALALAEVQRAALAEHVLLKSAGYALDRADAAVLAARGTFDPLYQAELGLTPLRRSRVDAGGFPVESEETGYLLNQTVGAFAPTGTGWELGLAVAHDRSSTLVRLGGGSSEVLYTSYETSLALSVTQELLRGVRMRYNLQNVTRATDSRTAAELARDQQRQETTLAATTAYWAWSYAVQAHAIAVDATSVAEEALRVGQVQVEKGQLAPVEGTRLEAALVQARQDEIDAANAAEAAANVVLTLMGEDPGQPVSPATPAGDVPDLALDPDKVLEVADAQNLELALARHQLAAAQRELDFAEHGRLPSLTAVGTGGVTARRCPAGTDDQGCEIGGIGDALGGLAGPDFRFLTVGGVFTAPLGNRAARGSRDDAAVGVLEREVLLGDLQRQVAARVEEQVRALQSSRARTELADANQRLAEVTLAAEEALAAAGRTIQKNVLEARTEVARTRNEAARARTDYRLAQAQLLALQGQLTE